MVLRHVVFDPLYSTATEGMSLFSWLSSVCVNQKVMRWNKKWLGKEIVYIVYTNGKKFAEEQDRSLFLGVESKLRANHQNIRVRR